MKTYITEDGIELHLTSVSDTLINKYRLKIYKEFLERGEPVDPPKYKVITAGGGVEEHEHTEATLEVTPEEIKLLEGVSEEEAQKLAVQRTEENKAAWQKHLEARKRLEEEQNMAYTKAMLIMGVKFDMPEDDSWEEAHRFVRTTIRLAGQYAIGTLEGKLSKLEGFASAVQEWEEDLIKEWLS